jgi:selenocysteine lyase/cysteine desulfurase
VMERRRSLGGDSVGSQSRKRAQWDDVPLSVQASAVNYPGNPRFRLRVAFKLMDHNEEVERRRQLLSDDAVVIVEEGLRSVQSREEIKDII